MGNIEHLPFSLSDRDQGWELMSWTRVPQILKLVQGFLRQVPLQEVETIFSSHQVLQGQGKVQRLQLQQQLREAMADLIMFMSSVKWDIVIVSIPLWLTPSKSHTCLLLEFWQAQFAKVEIQALVTTQFPESNVKMCCIINYPHLKSAISQMVVGTLSLSFSFGRFLITSLGVV